MEFNYNGHMTFEERINDVANDIIHTYQEIPFDLAKKIASLEDPINDSKYNPVNEFKRSYNIMFLTNNLYNNTYEKAFNNLKDAYIKIDESKNDFLYFTNILIELINYQNKERKDFPNLLEF